MAEKESALAKAKARVAALEKEDTRRKEIKTHKDALAKLTKPRAKKA